jgi:copper homeostasis protein (lipoprotein)
MKVNKTIKKTTVIVVHRYTLTGTCIAAVVCLFMCACNGNGKAAGTPVVYKGLYTAGPNVISFKDCDNGHEFWVADNSNSLQQQYNQLTLQKPYIPVYVEAEGKKIKSGREGMVREFDSTLIITKVLRVTKQIPQDICN